MELQTLALALAVVWTVALIGARIFPGDPDLVGRLRMEEVQRQQRQRMLEARERLGRRQPGT